MAQLAKKETIPFANPLTIDLTQHLLLPHSDMGKQLHLHDCFELSFITSGYGEYTMVHHTLQVGPGDLVFFNHLEPHYLEVYDEPLTLTNILFYPGYIYSNVSSPFDYAYVRIFYEHLVGTTNLLKANLPYMPAIRAELEQLTVLFSHSEPNLLIVKAHFMLLLAHLSEHTQSIPLRESKTSESLLRIEEVLSYIHLNYRNQLTLEELSKLIHVTPSYLCTLFKRLIGVSFIDYVNKLRIHHSLDELKNTSYKITQIALDSGFNNTTCYNTTFQKHMGMTPSVLERTTR